MAVAARVTVEMTCAPGVRGHVSGRAASDDCARARDDAGCGLAAATLLAPPQPRRPSLSAGYASLSSGQKPPATAVTPGLVTVCEQLSVIAQR